MFKTNSASKKKSCLRAAYEEVRGQISDRHWRRIIAALKLDEEAKGLPLLQQLKRVRDYARLRQVNGNRLITLEDVERCAYLNDFAESFLVRVQGRDLIAACQILKPSPTERTIRLWGDQLNIPIRSNRWYEPHETQKLLRKIVGQVKFKYPEDSLRRI